MLSGCAATGPPFQAANLPASDALVYVFRSNALTGCVLTPTIEVDGKKAGELRNGGYLPLYMSEGIHVLSVPFEIWDWNIRCNTLSMELKPGEVYYVALETEVSIVLPSAVTAASARRCRLSMMPEASALPLLKETCLSQ